MTKKSTDSVDDAIKYLNTVLPGWEASVNTQGHAKLFPPYGHHDFESAMNDFDLKYFARGETPAAALLAAIEQTLIQEEEMTDANEVIERAALAHYEAYFEILIDDLEPSWKGADDSHRDRMISAMQAALSTLRPGSRLPGGVMVEQDWQPIETAPKDGTEVFIGRDAIQFGLGEYPAYSGQGFYDEEIDAFSFYGVLGKMQFDRPTHWKPLPAAPMLSALEEKNDAQ